MKKKILKTIAAAVMVFAFTTAAHAQVSLSLNIGRQPAWGPSGYNHVDYYYLPDIESYYDVSTGQYIYQNGGQWIFANSLPPRYRGYDLYSGYKVVVNRPKPYLNFNRDRASYGRYKNWSGARQPMLRESRNGGNRIGNQGNMNHGNQNQRNNGMNRGNMNQGNGMNRGNMNQGAQQNHMNNGNGQNRPQGGQGGQNHQQGGQPQGQNRQQNDQGGQQNGGGGHEHGGRP